MERGGLHATGVCGGVHDGGAAHHPASTIPCCEQHACMHKLVLHHAVGDWEACGDTFYAREHLYDMQWQEVELEHMRCVAQPIHGLMFQPLNNASHQQSLCSALLVAEQQGGAATPAMIEHLHCSQTAHPLTPPFNLHPVQGVLRQLWRPHRHRA